MRSPPSDYLKRRWARQARLFEQFNRNQSTTMLKTELTPAQKRRLILRQLEERALMAKTFDDLAAVLVDLLRRLRHENHEG